jgi:hypothetical protein
MTSDSPRVQPEKEFEMGESEESLQTPHCLRRPPLVCLLFLASFLVLACSSASTPDDAGSEDGGPLDAGPSDAGASDAGPAREIFTLSINNYRDWCSIAEDGIAFTPNPKHFFSGAVVNLHAAPLPGFVWGYWTGTDADTGSHDTSMTATATMTGYKSLLACCPSPLPASQTCP